VSAVPAVEVIIVVAFLLASIKILRKYERGFMFWPRRGSPGPKVRESSWTIPVVFRSALGNASARITKQSSPEMSTCLEHKPAQS
jgi:hypothetical protein